MKGAVIAALIVLTVLAGNRMHDNWDHRMVVPASCQIFGGHWTWWNGWECQ